MREGTFTYYKGSEIDMAKTTEEKVKQIRTRLQQYRKLMWNAVDEERYEAAAVLRDRIRNLQKKLLGALQKPVVKM